MKTQRAKKACCTNNAFQKLSRWHFRRMSYKSYSFFSIFNLQNVIGKIYKICKLFLACPTPLDGIGQTHLLICTVQTKRDTQVYLPQWESSVILPFEKWDKWFYLNGLFYMREQIHYFHCLASALAQKTRFSSSKPGHIVCTSSFIPDIFSSLKSFPLLKSFLCPCHQISSYFH